MRRHGTPSNVLTMRLRQLRLARGLTLDALAAAMGGLVTKQSLSSYEGGKTQPSLRVLTTLARALRVKTLELYRAPDVQIEVLAFREKSHLGKKEQKRVEHLVARMLEDRTRLQDLIAEECEADIPAKAMRVRSLDAVEERADELRRRWNLGDDPVARMTDVLEDHHVYVAEIDASEKFDGLAAVARSDDGTVRAAAVVSRRGLPAARQRLNLAHELGHLLLRPAKGVDEEKAAFRFGAAFLAPADTLRREVGVRRSAIGLDELLLLKRRYGMSLQALVHRLHDLGVINDRHAEQWWRTINAQGWKRVEPEETPAEQPQWLRRTTLRAFSEGLLTASEAETLLGEKVAEQASASLIERRAFMRLPLDERRRMLEEQADTMADYYRRDSEWRRFAVAEPGDE
jgi:Zn-dependent peptidase ImmA (M78 family)/DNA-binding XRE family transcriptional regulator